MHKLSIQTNIWSASLVDEWVSNLAQRQQRLLNKMGHFVKKWDTWSIRGTLGHSKWDTWSMHGTLGQYVGHLVNTWDTLSIRGTLGQYVGHLVKR